MKSPVANQPGNLDSGEVVIERGQRVTTTTTISDSSNRSSTSDEVEEQLSKAISDNHHHHHRHVVHTVDIEQSVEASSSSGLKGKRELMSSPPPRRTSAEPKHEEPATSSAAAEVADLQSSEKNSAEPNEAIQSPPSPPVVRKVNCESCAARVIDNYSYSKCSRSKSLPHPGKKGTGGGPSLGDSGEITTIRELTSEQSNSVSGVLRFCKRRVLFPYLKLLGAMGLKPLYADGNNRCVMTLSKGYLILVGIVLIVGFGMQFMTCFRRDHGFSYKQNILTPPTSLHQDSDFFEDPNSTSTRLGHAELLKSVGRRSGSNEEDGPLQKWFLEDTICTGNVIYVYIVPSILHLTSFIYMVYLYWIYDDEHLQNLMERVFIQAAHANINFFSQRRLIRRLQGLVGIGTIWISLLTFCQIAQVYLSKIYFNFWIQLDYDMTYAMSAILLFATLWQDAIQVTIVMSFAIQCNLICTYTELIKGRLMQHSITLPECMRELGELGQLLSYLNDDLALGLAPLLLIDGIYATGSIVHLIKNGKHLDLASLCLLVLTAILWIFIIVFPLAQAASVSTCCQKLKDMGHMVRIRPFGYQFVSQFDLDSFLLFASNLNLKARILKVPITSPILSMVAIALSTTVFLWGYFQ